MQETQVRVLGQDDPLETGMETHSSILAREFLNRGAWRALSTGLQRVGLDRVTTLSLGAALSADGVISQGRSRPQGSLTRQQLCRPPALFSVLLKHDATNGKRRAPVLISALTPHHLTPRRLRLSGPPSLKPLGL